MTRTLYPREGKALDNLHAARKVRLRCPDTGALLHISGKGTTRDVAYSWLGFNHQAECLEQRAKKQGEDWPFVAIPRAMIDAETPIDPLSESEAR